MKFSLKSLENSSQLKKLKPYLDKSPLWRKDCQSIARGVAAGFAGAVIPGFQFFYAALLAILLRGNLPVALLCTFITNPLTVVPVTYFIYFVGSLIIKNGNRDFVIQPFYWDFSSFHAFWAEVGAWLVQFGKGFLVGLPIVSLGLGIIGYFGAILVFKAYKKLNNN